MKEVMAIFLLSVTLAWGKAPTNPLGRLLGFVEEKIRTKDPSFVLKYEGVYRYYGDLSFSLRFADEAFEYTFYYSGKSPYIEGKPFVSVWIKPKGSEGNGKTLDLLDSNSDGTVDAVRNWQGVVLWDAKKVGAHAVDWQGKYSSAINKAQEIFGLK